MTILGRRMLKKRSNARLLSNILIVMAIGLLITGSGVSLYYWHANETIRQQAAKLVYQANHNINHTAPSTIKPDASVVATYVVAPTLPRYLIIPKLSIDSRILLVGVNAQGAMGTPNNIYDTAWYDNSAQPGQQGAMLIDGHVSSWTAHGVFFGLNTLLPGDAIDVQGGNGAVFAYQVVKTQIYDANNVDMTAAMASIDPTKPGLNLISCTGDVTQGTNEFNERIMVFAVET